MANADPKAIIGKIKLDDIFSILDKMSDLSSNPDLFGTQEVKAKAYMEGKLYGRKKYYVAQPDSGSATFGSTVKFKFQQQNRAGAFKHILQDAFVRISLSAPTYTGGVSTYVRWVNAIAFNVFQNVQIWSNGSLIVQSLNPNALVEWLQYFSKHEDWNEIAADTGYGASTTVRAGAMTVCFPLDFLCSYVDNFLADIIQDQSFEWWFTFNTLANCVETDGTGGTLGGTITQCYIQYNLLEGNLAAVGTQLVLYEQGVQDVVNPNVPDQKFSVSPGFVLPDINVLDNGAPGILIPAGTTQYSFDFSPYTQYALIGVIAYFQLATDVAANIKNARYQPWDHYQLVYNTENLDNWSGSSYHSYAEYWATIRDISNIYSVLNNLIGTDPQVAAANLTNVLIIPYTSQHSALGDLDNPFTRASGHMSFYPFNKPFLNFRWNTPTAANMYLRVIPLAYRLLKVTGEPGNARLEILYQ